MNEYEMSDLILSRYANIAEQASLYFALVSGYVIMAFIIGKRLSRLQIFVINSLFIMWTAGILMGYNTSVEAVFELSAAIGELESPTVEDHTGSIANFHMFSAIQLIGIVASLIFMWSVRRSEDE